MLFKNKEEINYWESFSDLMTGLMIIFIFIAMAYMYQMQKTVTEVQTTQNDIYEDLRDEFTEDEMQQWGAKINEKTLAVEFYEPEINFAAGRSDLQPRFKYILQNFMPRYLNVLMKDKYKNVDLKVCIEGYTSQDWGKETDPDKIYLNNMELSQSRARSVLIYSLQIPQLRDKKDWIKEHITANGLAFSNARETADSSRRVEIRVSTDTANKKTLEELSRQYNLNKKQID